jgi:hypothetical protein
MATRRSRWRRPGGPSRKRQLDLASEVGRLRRENGRLRRGRDIKSRAYVRIGLPMKPYTCIDTSTTAPLPNRAYGNAKAEHLVARIARVE